MHIVIDARIINSSTGTYIQHLLDNLQMIDLENNYSVLVRKKDLEFWKPTNKNFNVIEADFANYSFAEQFKLAKLLRQLRPDLVHFCMPQQPIFYKGKVVTTIHDLTLLKTYSSDKNWFVYHFKQLVGFFVFKVVIQKSNIIITDSLFSKKEIGEFSKKALGKTESIYLSAEILKADHLALYKHPFKNFLLYVGQQSDYKNLKGLAAAHQKLLEKYPGLGLILVGRKDTAAKNNEIYFQKKEYKNIIFTDFIENQQRDWLYANCSAYVFPSFMEGFGLPGLEAMGYGAPVVSSNKTCLPEIYGDAAVYFNPYDTEDMVNKINTVISNKDLREELITKGHKRIKDFSWQKTAEETLAVYTKVLEEN